jgi:hypothetical protein
LRNNALSATATNVTLPRRTPNRTPLDDPLVTRRTPDPALRSRRPKCRLSAFSVLPRPIFARRWPRAVVAASATRPVASNAVTTLPPPLTQ